MKKVALVFLVAVIAPSLVLAWLAVRSLRDQQFLLERQQSLLYQGVADTLATKVESVLSERQREFGLQVDALLAKQNSKDLAFHFDDALHATWPLAEVGFAVTLSGNILSPSCASPPNAGTRTFCLDNGAFLCNREVAEVYWNAPGKGGNQFADARNGQVQVASNSGQNLLSWNSIQLNGQPNAAQEPQQELNSNLKNSGSYSFQGRIQSRKVNPVQQATQPAQNEMAKDEQAQSKIIPAEAEFRQLIGEGRDGMLARFLQNKLKLMFWHRPEPDPNLVFGAQIDLARVISSLQALVEVEPVFAEEVCVALLDDNAKPVALSQPKFRANWKRPFVATEIGDALPHWEIGVYLLNPAKLSKTAQTLKLTFGLLIGLLVLAIGVGSWLIVSDLNRQLTLARQKTDFVSNVSHELKTPLTSIRMFAELLAQDRVADRGKQRSYLNIITSEAARLTRLINNVLDFSRMERGEKKYNMRECDLACVVREVAETYRPHLENNGFKFDCTLPAAPVSVRGDADALAQVVVNLLSNAEKYSNSRKEISVEVALRDGPLPFAETKVLDRGLGVPDGSAEKIFEQFYRAHDSLSSGIQGSGLGLTLARQIARAHGGDVTCESREGGGSCFSLRLPLQPT